MPQFTGDCLGNLKVIADASGTVFINGKAATPLKSNKSYFEASRNGTTISIALANGSLIYTWCPDVQRLIGASISSHIVTQRKVKLSTSLVFL